MKALNVIVKIAIALAAIAGVVYIAATYGDRIVAWAKRMLGCGFCECECECTCDGDCDECEEPKECCIEDVDASVSDGDFEG